ncbi:MAG: BamA/TamA family outer membrane protein, partial [Crocinitomicaceae bacterium]|nr:BamA/TamA family outer membrane protein [Crocinitomicaceae bacterium]
LSSSAEYRFAVNSFLKGAFFIDAGNVWTMLHDDKRPGGQLTKSWWNELAIAAGAGFRMDLDYFIIRLDVGFPLRNPALPVGERWFFTKNKPEFEAESLQEFGTGWENFVPKMYFPKLHFGIGYPF